MRGVELDEESRCSDDVLVETPRGTLRVEDAATPLRLSLVIPTYNEAANLRPLLEHLTATLDETLPGDYELIVVDDDSPDGTGSVAVELTKSFPSLRVMRRRGEHGLSTAVIRGWQVARGQTLGVIDADLQHPPEVIRELWAAIEGGADLAVGSRHVDGGGVGDWSFVRRALSRGAQFVGLATLPRVVGRVSDPMSGYFIVRRNAISAIEMSPLGYKILLEVLGRGRIRNVAEVGYVFRERVAGSSKVTSRVYFEHLAHLLRLRFTTMGSGANPNGTLARHLPAAAYAVLIAFAAYSIVKAPAYNWDLIPYVGAVLSPDANSVQQLHDDTYRVVQHSIPAAQFDVLTSGAHSKVVFQDPQSFVQQLPFYKIRPAYVGVLRTLYRLGINPVRATVLVSLLSYLGICVLLWKWLSRLLSGPLLFVAATCIALTQPLVEVASLSSPDALSTAVLLFAIYLLVERDRWLSAATLLYLSLFVRSDNLFTVLLVAAFTAWRWRNAPAPRRAVPAAFACVALATVFVSHHVAGNYGWAITIEHSFVKLLDYPALTHVHLSPALLGRMYLQGLASIRYSGAPVFALLLVLAVGAHRRLRDDAQTTLRLAMAALMLGGIVLHVLVFPIVSDRFFVAHYLAIGVLSIGGVLSFGARESSINLKRPPRPLRAATPS